MVTPSPDARQPRRWAEDALNDVVDKVNDPASMDALRSLNEHGNGDGRTAPGSLGQQACFDDDFCGEMLCLDVEYAAAEGSHGFQGYRVICGLGEPMIRALKVILATASGAALAVSFASPALATNELKVKVDPLNWNWSGQLTELPRLSLKGETVDFFVQAGGGPQQVFNTEIGGNRRAFELQHGGVLSSGDIEKIVPGFEITVENPPVGGMSETPGPGNFDYSYSFSKQEDANGKAFYELKFFANTEAPQDPPADLALQNLHEAQSEGVQKCDVAKSLSPGDELSTGDANDTVCVTLDDGDGSSDAAIVIDTGDGNDTVLIDGDTDVDVKVDTGRGNDVVVADTDADVDVTTGDGHDAVVDGGNTTVTDVEDEDQEVEVQ